MLSLIVFLLIFVILLYLYLKNDKNYWKKMGIKTPQPSLLFGNIKDIFLMKKSMGQLYADIYKDFPNSAVVGIYKTAPALLIRDPDVIEQITVKQFSCFRDVDFSVDEKADPLFGNNPFSLKGDKWKKYRNYLAPCFTAPKLRNVFPVVLANAEKLVKYISEQTELTNGKGLEPKKFFELFTAETVANVAFGIDGKSFEQKDVEFRKMATDTIAPNILNSLKVLLMTVVPQLGKIFNIRFFSSHVQARLIEIMSATIKHRRENNVIRNDFVDIFDSTIKKNNLDVIDACIFASAFFIDAYETSSALMAFATYELCTNFEVQEKLRQEINAVIDEHHEGLTYEIITNEMPYLSAVLNETLRKYAPLPFLSRTCTKACTLESQNDEFEHFKVDIPEDTVIIIPSLGLHHDAKYFPEPETFKPERFLQEFSADIKKFTFLPFGDGPRICIGRKFGTLQAKLALAYLIKNYKVELNYKTKTPLEINPLFFLMAIKEGFWANLYKI